MLDPPPDKQNAVQSIALPTGSCHLRRVCRTSSDHSDESRCEFILLLSNTRFGRTDGVNHVVLSCPDNLNIRDCHATIRAIFDQLNGNIRRYELLAHQRAFVQINGYQIETEQSRPLCPGDSIMFGNKLSDSSSFVFQFELANGRFNYPITRQNLCSSPLKTLTIFNDSLVYKSATLNATTEEETNLIKPASQFNYEKSIQSELILEILKASRQQLNLSAKENLLLDYCPSIPMIANKIATPAIHEFVEVSNGQTVHASPLNVQQPVYKAQLPTKFDVDLIEVAKKIANRIAKYNSCEDPTIDEYDQQNNNVEKSHLQLPLIASVTNLNVYPCNTSLTSSSMSPPSYSEFQHASETSSNSASLNHSDSGNFSANESGHSNFNMSSNSLSSICVKNEEEPSEELDEEELNSNEEQENKPNEVSEEAKPTLPKSSSAARLEMLAALASSSNSESFDEEMEQKPLEIYIPLTNCSDRDDSLSPAQTVKSEKILSPTSSTPHRLSKHRSSRQSTHDAEDSHIHTTKQLKTQAGIEVCRRRMLKYIANNLYTAQIVKKFQSSPVGLKSKREEARAVVESGTQVPNIEMPKVEQQLPKPLNLYPDGEEYVKNASKQQCNSKNQTLSETVTDAEHLLFATLLLSVRAPKAPATNLSTHSSASNNELSPNDELSEKQTEVEVDFVFRTNDVNETVEFKRGETMDVIEKIEKRIEAKPIGPSREEEQLLLKAEHNIPKLTGVGRHTMSKFRLLYRAELDRSSIATIPTQHHKLVEKCRENRLRFEEKQKQVEKKKQAAGKRRMAKRSSDQLPSPNGRNPLGSPIARMPIVKKSSNPARLNYQCATGQKRQSTDFSSLSIHQLAKDPNFDGFLTEEYGAAKKVDPFGFNEEEDPFSLLNKSATPQNLRPFFPMENARSAAISANASIHKQQHRQSRKRQQSGQPTADTPTKKGRRNSSTPKPKRGRLSGRGPGRKPKKSADKEEEPCASMDCSPKKVASASGVIEWIACDTCLAWFHCFCVLGINRPVGDDENFQCHRCQQS